MAEAKSKYRVRDHFALHFVDGSDPVEGGEIVELTDEEAEFYAAQIEPVDTAKKKVAKDG